MRIDGGESLESGVWCSTESGRGTGEKSKGIEVLKRRSGEGGKEVKEDKIHVQSGSFES